MMHKIFRESDEHANDFLGETCYYWEKAADSFKNIAERIVKIRIGVVLAAEGGALKKMLLPFKLGFGSPLGSGKQFFPWIHIDDLVNIFIFALENENINGSYNAVADEQLTNREFGSVLAKTLGKPYFMPPVPAFLLKLIFGETASVILEGSAVANEKIKSAGFKFQFSKLEDALQNILTK